jgi:hypothetical protein
MGVWGSIFGWRALFRWDALGVVVPGIFVAAGLGMLGVEWFPYHLLLAQICFAVAGLLSLVKIIGHAIESKDTVKSRLIFGVTLGLVFVAGTVWVDYAIQMHMDLVALTIQPPPLTPPSLPDLTRPVPNPKPNTPSRMPPKRKAESSQGQLPDVTPKAIAPSPPQQTTRGTVPAPASAPESIIPADPVKAVEAVDEMRDSLVQVLGKKDTITFLISWPDDDNSNLVFVSDILGSACRTSPRQCWFTQAANPTNLDYPTIPQPTRRGLTIHGADASSISMTLGRWFSTYSSSSIPQQFDVYKYQETKELIWVEIGPGSPWKAAN